MKQPIQLSPPIIELITITIATTTYPKKKRQFPKWRNFELKTLSPLEIFVLGVFVFSEIEMVMINWEKDFLSFNSVCNHTCDKQIGLPLRGRQILLITRMITDRIGLPITIINQILPVSTKGKFCRRVWRNGYWHYFVKC